MKIEGFLVAIISLMTLFSCSMEDDAIFNDQPGRDVIVGDESAIVSASVFFPSLSPKSSESSSAGEDLLIDQNIRNAVVFLLNGDVVESVKSAVTTDNVTSRDFSFYTKAGENKYLYAVANVSPQTLVLLKDCKNLAAIKAVPLTNADLALAPKASESVVAINFNAFKEGTDQTLYNKDPIKIKVTQRTARVELAAVDYAFAAGVVEYPDVVLESVSLNRQVVTGGLVDGLNPSFENLTWDQDILKNEGNKSFNVNGVFFRTFANNSTTEKTALALQFKVNGKLSSVEVPFKEYTIKTPASNEMGYTETVESNHIYRLTIRAIVSSGDIEISVKGKVQDWNKNTVELDPIWGEDNK